VSRRRFGRAVRLYQHHGRAAAEREGGDPEGTFQGSDRSLGHVREGGGRWLANPCTARDASARILVQIGVAVP
jgi:hypothetical protein